MVRRGGRRPSARCTATAASSGVRQPAVGALPYVGAREPGLRRGRAGAWPGTPGCTTVVDVGAGGGELLVALHDLDPTLRLVGVDLADRPRRPARRHRAGRPRSPTALDALLVANEWLDDVPVDVVELTDAGWRLVLVDPATGDERLGPPPDDADRDWLDRWWPAGEVGDRAEVGRPRDEAWAAAVRSLRRGARGGRRLRAPAATAARRAAPSPATATAARCRRSPTAAATSPATSRWTPAPPRARAPARPATLLTTQRAALHALGVRRSMPPHELSRTDPAGYLRALSLAGEVAELTDPAGLGGFGWLVQGVGVRAASAADRHRRVAAQHERRPAHRVAGQLEVGAPAQQGRQRDLQLHPGQRRAEAVVQPGAEPDVRVGPAADVEACRRPGTRPGRGWPSRAGRPPCRRPGPSTSPSTHVGSSRCARTAAAASRSGSSPRSPARPGRRRRAAGRAGRGARSSATTPLPNALTDASCPALSSRIADATSSSAGQPLAAVLGGDQVADQVVARLARGARRRGRACSRRTPPPRRRRRARRPRRCGRTRTSRRSPADHGRSRCRSASGTPSSSAMTATGSGSAKSAIRSNDAGSTRVEQRVGGRLHPRPQPLDVAAGERLGDQRPQPGVRRRLVLHHLVAVQPVERLELLGRLLVRPQPAEPAVAQHARWRRRRSAPATARSARARPAAPTPAAGRGRGRGRRRRPGRRGRGCPRRGTSPRHDRCCRRRRAASSSDPGRRCARDTRARSTSASSSARASAAVAVRRGRRGPGPAWCPGARWPGRAGAAAGPG